MEGSTEFQKPQKEQLKPENQTLEVAGAKLLRRIKNGITKAFGKEESKEPIVLPKIKTDILYTYHTTKEDREGLRERLESADVYIPEFFEWTGDILKMFRNHSAGKGRLWEGIPAIELKFLLGLDPFLKEELRVIYNSHKPIGMIDVKQKIFTDFDSEREYVLRSTEDRYTKFRDDFPQRLDIIRNYLKSEAHFHNNREKYMISQLRPTIQEVIKTYPSLKDKSELKVLLSLGIGHTFMYHKLKRNNQETRRIFNRMPMIHGFEAEALRRYIFGRKVDDELVSKVFLEGVFFKTHVLRRSVGYIGDSSKIERYVRQLISQFNFEEAKEIFRRLTEGETAKKLFEAKFQEKGIKLPTTERELDEFLARPASSRPNSPEQKS